GLYLIVRESGAISMHDQHGVHLRKCHLRLDTNCFEQALRSSQQISCSTVKLLDGTTSFKTSTTSRSLYLFFFRNQYENNVSDSHLALWNYKREAKLKIAKKKG
ncbi:unnamed protein product, partial [Brassica rapa subsp. narinosa]